MEKEKQIDMFILKIFEIYNIKKIEYPILIEEKD